MQYSFSPLIEGYSEKNALLHNMSIGYGNMKIISRPLGLLFVFSFCHENAKKGYLIAE